MNMRRLLAASLGLNVFWLGLEAYLVRRDLGDLSSLPPLVVCFPAAESDPAIEAGDTAASPEAEPGLAYAIATIESPEFRDYVAHLRSLGCPDETIRQVIATDVSEYFRGRVKGKAYTASRFGP